MVTETAPNPITALNPPTALNPTTALNPKPPAAEGDLMLLHRFTLTGDPAVFAEIVQRYARVVYSASIRILNDEGRAQDVSQETFFRLMQRPKLVTHSLAGWLHRTATHLALDVRRSERSRRLRETLYGIEHQETKSARPGWAEVSPYVDQALNEIKEPARGLLIRHFLQGVAQSQLATELDVSAATLSRRIKAGLEELQQNLRKRGIHLGLSTLGFFCTANTGSPVPTAFFAELGKMHLIASIRSLPIAPPPPSFPLKPVSNPFIPAKFAWTLASIITLVTLYAIITAASWTQTRPFVSAPMPERLQPCK